MNERTFEYTDEKTTGSSPKELLQWLLIKRTEQVEDNLNDYYGSEARGTSGHTYRLTGTIKTLFIHIEPMMKKTLEEERYETIREMTFSDDIDEQIAAFRVMNQFLYEKNLLKIDTKQWYDKRRAEAANRAEGL
jgi:hypothetical protein